MGLWRMRTLSADQKTQIAEGHFDQKDIPIMLEDTESILNLEYEKMSKVYTAELPINVSCWLSSLFPFYCFVNR